MSKLKPPEVRRLERLFTEKFIPWAEGRAPLVLLSGIPRASLPVPFRQRPTAPLPETERERRSYPEIRHWVDRRLNSVSVPLLGCIFEGEADYRVHTAPGAAGCESVVAIAAGSLFAVAPDTPFSDGSKIAWEREGPPPGNISGVLWRLQRDGVGCLTFTCQNNTIWLHPYVFLYQTEAALLGDKLLAELRLLPPLQPAAGSLRDKGPAALSGRPEEPDTQLAGLYWQLILRLLHRTMERGAYTVLRPGSSSLHAAEHQFPSLRLPPGQITRVASDFVDASLDDPALSTSLVAARAGLSERHLNRLFEAETGVSVFRYIQQQRAERACDLLTHRRIAIRAVAGYCGFTSVSAFSTWFSKRLGCTPRSYRARCAR